MGALLGALGLLGKFRRISARRGKPFAKPTPPNTDARLERFPISCLNSLVPLKVSVRIYELEPIRSAHGHRDRPDIRSISRDIYRDQVQYARAGLKNDLNELA
jgi:hypothetical protein